MTDDDRRAEVQALPTRQSKTCGHCGEEKSRDQFAQRSRSRDGMSPWCRSCNAEYARAHYEANRAKRNAQARANYAANKTKRNAQQRAWNQANRERLRDYNRDRRIRWAAENPERMAGLIRRAHLKRRALLRGASVGPIDLDALWTGSCGICSQELSRAFKYPDLESPSVDHIIPLSKGGAHQQENLQWAHLFCNWEKGASLESLAEVS